MFKNYLKISLRNLTKQKSYSFINIFGLSLGLTCFILISLFIHYELSYDSFHEYSDRSYRVVAEQPQNEYLGSKWFALSPTAMAATMKEEFSEVEFATYFTGSRAVLRNGNQRLTERGVASDGDFFNVFTYSWYAGNKTEALKDPGSIILTKSTSQKLFNDENPIGKIVHFIYPNGSEVDKTVTGIVGDPPQNSHFTFKYVVNDQTTPYYTYNLNEWSNTNVYTFITLKDRDLAEDFSEKIPGFASKYIGASDYYQNNPDAFPSHRLQSLEDIHLHSKYLNFNPYSIGDIKLVYTFSAIALFILLIACVNYMNLSTARSLTRSKEVGVRKVIGAYRSNLMMQFLSEAVLVSLISIAGAVIFVFFLLPVFSELVNRELNTGVLLSWEFWVLTISASFLVGVVSGSYPAFYLSKIKPISAFKSENKNGKSSTFFRNVLVVTQFSITGVLLIGAAVVFHQMDYLKNTDTGLKREQVLVVPQNDPEFWNRFETIKSDLISYSGVEIITASQYDPIYMSSKTSGTEWEGKQENQELSVYVSPVHYDFIELFGIELIQGQSFSPEIFKETEASYIVNEIPLKELGWELDEAIGKRFSVWGNDGRIVGVAKNFNFISLDQPIAPLALLLGPKFNHRYLLLKTNPNNLQETIAQVESTVKTFSPGFPFSYSFLDDNYAQMYSDDIRTGTMFNYFSILALIIACMGLFGLATFVTEQRTKEIGIRKVLGANLFQIISLLNKDFLKLVGFSLIIAIPTGWYFASIWLKDFAFRINLNPVLFGVTSMIILSVAILTVSYKSIKTATANPVDSLKAE
ncbi:MAG: FtsX-like permease family protein [Balneola sp.]